jgi:adenylylsulfate kinase-like enzyme
MHTYVLDGDNIRHGLNSNLGFSPEDRVEYSTGRRSGELMVGTNRDPGFYFALSSLMPPS